MVSRIHGSCSQPDQTINSSMEKTFQDDIPDGLRKKRTIYRSYPVSLDLKNLFPLKSCSNTKAQQLLPSFDHGFFFKSTSQSGKNLTV